MSDMGSSSGVVSTVTLVQLSFVRIVSFLIFLHSSSECWPETIHLWLCFLKFPQPSTVTLSCHPFRFTLPLVYFLLTLVAIVITVTSLTLAYLCPRFVASSYCHFVGFRLSPSASTAIGLLIILGDWKGEDYCVRERWGSLALKACSGALTLRGRK
jgi:hypothetical protein